MAEALKLKEAEEARIAQELAVAAEAARKVEEARLAEEQRLAEEEAAGDYGDEEEFEFAGGAYGPVSKPTPTQMESVSNALGKSGQGHLLAYLEELNEAEKASLLA